MSKFWQKKYISKHTGAEIDEAVEAVLDGDVGTTVVANPTLAGTEAALTGLQVDETKYSVGGMTEAEGDLRYLQLSGGTMTGSIKVSYTGILDPQSNNLISLQSNNNWINVGSGGTGKVLRLHSGTENIKHIKSGDMYDMLDTANTSANPTLAGTEAALEGVKINGTSYKNQPSSMSYLTTAPTADNTDGIKIVVLSSEPATKYNGYLYIITA